MADYNGSLGSQYTLRLRVTLASQSVSGNSSVVNWSLVAIKNSGSGYYTFSAKGYGWNINGNSGSGAKTYDFRDYSALTLASGSYTIPHNSDGTKSISVSGFFNPDNGSGFGNGSASGTFTLPTIPRASQPTLSASRFDAGTAVTINMNRASSGFTHTVSYDFGALSNETIDTGVGTSVAWTPPLSLLNEIPDAVSGSGVITVKTYSGGTYIGVKTVGFTLKAPAGVVPTIGSITVAEATASPDVASLIGAYVQGVSTLAIGIVGAVGVYGSTIASRRITVNSQTINAASGVTTPITASGTVPIVAEVTDTRGRKSVFPLTNVTVLPHSKPIIGSNAQVRRATIGGVVSQSEGTYLRVDMAAVASSLIVGTQKNKLKYEVSTAPFGTGVWTTRVGPTDVGASTLAFDSYNSPNPYVLVVDGYALVVDGGPYPVNASFDVQIKVSDALSSTTVTRTVSTGAVVLDLNGKIGVGVGKYHELGKLDVAGDIYQSGDKVVDESMLASVIPSGVMMEFAGGTEPTGWLFCNGQSLRREWYPTLFAAIGVVYGAADSTHFNIPDKRGRVSVSLDSAKTEFNTLGEKGGAKTHTLTTGEMPAHSHTHNGVRIVSGSAYLSNSPVYYSFNNSPHPTSSTGGNLPHNNLQPYITVNSIIKI
jgi:microcystin-dependent protein